MMYQLQAICRSLLLQLLLSYPAQVASQSLDTSFAPPPPLSEILRQKVLVTDYFSDDGLDTTSGDDFVSGDGLDTTSGNGMNCNHENVKITELASPFDNTEGRYIELFFDGCKGAELTGDITVVTWKNIDRGGNGRRNLRESLARALQAEEIRTFSVIHAGTKIKEKGIYTICSSQLTVGIYVPASLRLTTDDDLSNSYNRLMGFCTTDTDIDSVADLDGSESVALLDCDGPFSSCDILDIFGYPGSLKPERKLQATNLDIDFTGGYAYRKKGLSSYSNKFEINEWVIMKWQSSSQMTPGEWQEDVGPFL